jgi:hypothetical protein
MTQSAPTATLIARIPIVFLMARSPLEVPKPLVAARATTARTSPHLTLNYRVGREFLDVGVPHCLSAIGALRRSKIALRC